MDKLSERLEAHAKRAASRAHWAEVDGEDSNSFWKAFAADLDAAAKLARRVEEAQACEVVSVRPTSSLPIYELAALDGRGLPGKCGQRVRLVREA
ncbi:hypothetical protein [Pseudoxanthomonas sp.]|uniref:hypothetical protein n=1 Tax=Pseudoxanthomonas sp. TaxID=1871049 RepID=UPI003F7E9329